MKKFILLLIALFVFTGCKSQSTDTDPAEESAAEEQEESASEEAPAPEPVEEAAPASTEAGSLVLETATLNTMGHTMLLPAGFSRDRETETGAGYSLDIGNYRNLMVSLEPQGASSADEARSMGPVVAGGLQVSEVVTAENGNFVVLFNTREHDSMQAVAVFTPTHYVKCMGPEPYLAELRQMCESLTPTP